MAGTSSGYILILNPKHFSSGKVEGGEGGGGFSSPGSAVPVNCIT